MLRAVLADVIHFATSKREAEDRMTELADLTNTYGGLVVVRAIQRKAKPDYGTFLGKGKVQELIDTWPEHKANVLVVNEILKPGQLYNLEEALRPVKMKVWDRIDLILQIFDKHATTAEAKLQIELARLRHMGPRIYNMGAELGRQRGGTGTRGGAGEGNTESMKRHLKEQERRILDKLKAYERQHTEQRKFRSRQKFKTVALVGYTNAGKTSLLNALTKRVEYAADKLFATLDTRIGELYLPEVQTSVLLSDTIGFIQGLPPELIQAFRSTLSEAVHADLILHVIDATDPHLELKLKVVEEILGELKLADRPRLRVFNKLDKLVTPPAHDPESAYVSAHAKLGLAELRSLIARRLFPDGFVVPTSEKKLGDF
ncbi:MAG: GTPase HflX [Patescibacteria group bacterium]